MERIGFTTTLPIEVILAAGLVPVDLNNAFINGPDPEADLITAETTGFPRSICAWIKGIYGTIRRLDIKRIVGVLEGDCSYTEGLMDVLEHEGCKVTGFRFPHEPNANRMAAAIEELAAGFGVSMDDAVCKWEELKHLRGMLRRLDELTVEARVTGEENFSFLINASDFEGDPAAYARKVAGFLEGAEKRPPKDYDLRLAVIGIPPAFTDLENFLEGYGVHVVYNEMPAEFAMIRPTPDIVTQYANYTYPYSFQHRLRWIKEEVARRNADGVIHYVQTFCYRGIYNMLLKEALDVPVLALEGDRPARIGGRETLRIESFIEMLTESRNGR